MNLNPFHALGNVLKFDWNHGGSLFAEGSKDILGFGWSHGGAGAAKGALGSALGHLSLAQLWALLLAVVAAIWQILLGYFPALDHAVKGLVHPSAYTASCAATTVPVGGIAGVGYRFGSLAHTAINPPDFNPEAMQAKLEAAGRKLGAGIAEGWAAFQKSLHGAPTPTTVLPPAAQVSVPSCCPAQGPASIPASMTGGADTAARAIISRGATGNLAVTLTAIAGAESGWTPTAIGPVNSNGTRDYGMWQINSAHNPTAVNWADPSVNAQLAMAVFRGQGLSAWTTYNSGAYQQFMAAAQTAVSRASGVLGPFLPASVPTVPVAVCTPGQPAVAPPGGSATVERAITFALAQVGKPYVWGAPPMAPGGPVPTAYDCSSLVQSAFLAGGLPLPGRQTTRTLIGLGTPVAQSALQRGDIVFPDSSHVVIYLGAGQVVEAPQPGQTVHVIPFYGMWQARRLVPVPTV